jgi:hypothetical protein
MPKLVPSTAQDFEHYYDMARAICRTARHREHLSDDEIIVLTVVASQVTLARYVEPGARDTDEVLDAILGLLDRREVVQAVKSKMAWLLNHRPISRPDAPPGKLVDTFHALSDPEEPGMKS